MKKILLIIILFLFIENIQSQVSGYMGKKVSIIYGGGFGVPYVDFNSSPYLKFGKNHSFNLEYIYSNKKAIAFRYKLGLNKSTNEDKSFEDYHKFKSHTFSIIRKSYKKNTLAPIGRYKTIGIGFQHLLLKDVVGRHIITDKTTSQDYDYTDIIFHFGAGKNWVLSDIVLLGFQIEYSMPLGSTLRTIYPSGYSDSSMSRNRLEKSYKTIKFNYFNELLRISLNIGFLAF